MQSKCKCGLSFAAAAAPGAHTPHRSCRRLRDGTHRHLSRISPPRAQRQSRQAGLANTHRCGIIALGWVRAGCHVPLQRELHRQAGWLRRQVYIKRCCELWAWRVQTAFAFSETVGIGSLPPFRFVWHRDADKQLLALTARDRLRRNDAGLESALRSDALAYVSVRSPVPEPAPPPAPWCLVEVRVCMALRDAATTSFRIY